MFCSHNDALHFLHDSSLHKFPLEFACFIVQGVECSDNSIVIVGQSIQKSHWHLTFGDLDGLEVELTNYRSEIFVRDTTMGDSAQTPTEKGVSR